LFTRSALVRGTTFAGKIRARWAAWEKLTDKDVKDRLDALRKDRQTLLDKKADAQVKGVPFDPADAARLEQVVSDLDLGAFEQSRGAYEAESVEDGTPKKLTPAAEAQRVRRFRDVISKWLDVLVEARNERMDAVRGDWPELPRVCVSGQDLLK